MNSNHQDIDESLLLQYLLGNADDALRKSVEGWLKADSGNRKLLDHLESLWLEAGKLQPEPVAVDAEAAWDKVSAKLLRRGIAGDAAKDNSGTRWLFPARKWYSAAAVVFLILGVYGIFRLANPTVQEVEVISNITVIHRILPDGSKVALGKDSKLIYPEKMVSGKREVKLTGVAYFEIRPDTASPFIVDAGAAKIEVLGTAFTVSTHPDGVMDPDGVHDPVRVGVVVVTVSHGRVLFFKTVPDSHDTVSVVLNAGESGIWENSKDKPVVKPSAAPDNHFWADRSLDFRKTALSDVFGLLEKYYAVNIVADDPTVLNCLLTASFANEPIDRILAVIAESFGLTLETSGKTYHFKGHGCSKGNE